MQSPCKDGCPNADREAELKMRRAKQLLRQWLRIDGLDTDEHNTVLRAALVLAAAAVGLRLFFWAYTGRDWEDSLITVLHSENFVNGLGLTHYLGGVERPLHGFTSPLSVLVPLLGDLIRAGFGLSLIKLVSALTGGLTVLYAMAFAVHPKIKLPAPLAVMVMGYLAVEHHQILWGMAGMETQMATLVLLMSLYFTIAEKTLPLGISLGLCMLARPDFAFWTVIVGLYLLVFQPRRLVPVTAAALVLYLPWIVFTTLYYGSPIPNTILAKEYGYPLWTTWPQFDHSPRAVAQAVWASVTGSYAPGAVFQPLGPSFAGHEMGYRAIIRDHGVICDFMVVMALLGAASALRRRSRAWLPVILFVGVYGVYYIFFVAIVFSWYLSPFVAAAVLLSARGIQAAGMFAVPERMRTRTRAWWAFAAAYLALFAALLPTTFATEKNIQERVENRVRKQVGLFLGHIMEKEETIGTEPLGYIGYYSRRIVYDWPGLCSRKVVEYSRTHPREQRALQNMLEHFRPDFIVLRFVEYEGMLDQTWLDDAYRPIRSFEVPFDAKDPLFHSPNINLGYLVLAKKTWHPDAAEWAGERIGIGDGDARALNTVGFRLMKRGDTAGAVRLLRQSIEACPVFPDARNNLGLALSDLGDTAGALEQIQKAVELAPEHALARNNLGALLAGQGDYENAARQLNEAIRCDAKYAQPHVNLGGLLARRGELAEARRHFEAALRIEPNNADALQGLQRITAMTGK